MSTLLYIQASPRGDRSKSIAVANAFVEAYRNKEPTVEVDTLDLFETDLPDFDGAALRAKYSILHGEDLPEDQARAWRGVEALIERFKAADKYLLAVPMWNFHIPYKLKQYIDVLVQPTYVFTYSPEEGYSGLITDKPALIVCSRGSSYSEGQAREMDYQTSYLRDILRFIGLTDIRFVVVEPTLMVSHDVARAKVQQAVAEATQLAAEF